MTKIFLSFFAGILAVLSPCVLPMLPILLVSSWQQHALGPLGLAAGLSFTFTFVGVTLAASGSILGISPLIFREFSIVLLLVLGGFLLSDWLQLKAQTFLNRFTHKLHQASHELKITGVMGQFLLGSLLAAIWIPCTGPTLALAIAMASRGNAGILQASSIMLAYSLGMSLPIILISYLSRGVLARRQGLVRLGHWGKKIMGALLVLFALLVATGWDEDLKEILADNMPDWFLAQVSR